MIEVGMRVRNLIEGREGIVVFSPYTNQPGFVAVEHGSGLTVFEVDEKNLENLGPIKVETDERCNNCIFYRCTGDDCARYTRKRFYALSRDNGGKTAWVPTKPYPFCIEEMKEEMAE